MELNFEGVGQQSRVKIQFDNVGAKWPVTASKKLGGTETIKPFDPISSALGQLGCYINIYRYPHL
ncbi:hypothetical protein MNZ22_18075 [Aeromonas encheleia]|uniref:hypothetical protein n=1 Tax=Aeromonas encheleia TaxID=73010 RepID=UPI001F596433|nr:hypothetical protein [Aeromonas encheleia]UNP88441.1 hypothetical protein MNZ22_18075 [Aeromonas encheleia]